MGCIWISLATREEFRDIGEEHFHRNGRKGRKGKDKNRERGLFVFVICIFVFPLRPSRPLR
jgi:hypothetical protein